MFAKETRYKKEEKQILRFIFIPFYRVTETKRHYVRRIKED